MGVQAGLGRTPGSSWPDGSCLPALRLPVAILPSLVLVSSQPAGPGPPGGKGRAWQGAAGLRPGRVGGFLFPPRPRPRSRQEGGAATPELRAGRALFGCREAQNRSVSWKFLEQPEPGPEPDPHGDDLCDWLGLGQIHFLLRDGSHRLEEVNLAACCCAEPTSPRSPASSGWRSSACTWGPRAWTARAPSLQVAASSV